MNPIYLILTPAHRGAQTPTSTPTSPITLRNTLLRANSLRLLADKITRDQATLFTWLRGFTVGYCWGVPRRGELRLVLCVMDRVLDTSCAVPA